MPARHRIHTPPRLVAPLSRLGGGGTIHPAFASLNYVAELKEMVAADPSLFRSEGNLHRRAAEVVVAALLAT